jgi:Ca-activated chloride channel family protein
MISALRAPRLGTGAALGTATAALVAALLLTPARPPLATSCTEASTVSPPSGILTARMPSSNVLPGEQHVAVSIQMPNTNSAGRPSLSLAIVIDRSGSMEGEPLANAKAAAERLVDQLAETDAFTVVTYSSSDEVVVPMTRATAGAKASAMTAIAGIWDDGNTCISCGIERASTQLQQSPVTDVRRIVLISDGQANTGIRDRGELTALATETAARGVSISTVGVGLEFDEVTMMRLADVGHGNYYFVENTANLATMFRRELAGLATTVAADARLVIEPAPGVLIEEAYGYQLLRQGPLVVVSLPDLRADQPLKVVLRTTITGDLGPRAVGHFELHWRNVCTCFNGEPPDSAVTDLRTTVTNDAALAARTIDRAAVTAIESARTARVLEDATIVYERDGAEAAQRLLERHRREVEANKNIDAPAAAAIEAASNDAIVNFAKAPPKKAAKAARSSAYELAR